MTEPLRAFLMLRSEDGVWSVSVFRDLEAVLDAWDGADSHTGVLHIGFSRPASQTYEYIAKDFPNMLLLSGGARYCFPPRFSASVGPVGYVETIPVFLALSGWGYICEDPTVDAHEAMPLTGRSPPTIVPTEPSGWVKDYLLTYGDDEQSLQSAGINNEETYIACESKLSGELRKRLGIARFRASVSSTSDDPCEMIQAAPPWMLDTAFKDMHLTVRVSNSFIANGLSHVRDLKRFNVGKLLHIQNFGRKSVADLRSALFDLLNLGPPEPPTVSVADNARLLKELDRSLATLDERDQDILRRRMGYGVPKQVLQEIGERYGVTRERIRQIEAKALSKVMIGAAWTGILSGKIELLLVGREFPLPALGIEAVDPWFEGVGKQRDTLDYILADLCEAKFKITTIEEVDYIGRVSNEEWDDLLREARRILATGANDSWSETHCRAAIDNLLDDSRREFRPLLWGISSRLCNFTEDGGLGRTLVSYGRGADQAVEAVLADAAEPLHFTEIARRVSDRLGKEVDPRRAHSAASTVGILLGRGIFGAARHIQLDDRLKQSIRDEMEQVILSGPDDRQWHSNELLKIAVERGLDDGGTLTKYNIDYLLSASPVLQRLGRMVWCKSASSIGSRIDVRQAVASLLVRAGQPLSTTEVRQRLIALRGLNSNFQVMPTDLVVRVGIGIWGLNDRDIPLKRPDQPAMLERIANDLSSRGNGVHVTEVKQFVEEWLECADSITPDAIFSLASLDGRMQISSSEYLYLREWGEPRRLTAAAAIQSVLARAEALTIDAIVEAAQFELKRPITRREAVLLLRASDAVMDEATGEWSIEIASEKVEETEIAIPSSSRLAPIQWTT